MSVRVTAGIYQHAQSIQRLPEMSPLNLYRRSLPPKIAPSCMHVQPYLYVQNSSTMIAVIKFPERKTGCLNNIILSLIVSHLARIDISTQRMAQTNMYISLSRLSHCVSLQHTILSVIFQAQYNPVYYTKHVYYTLT